MSQQFCHRLLFQSQPNPSPKLKLTLTLTLNLAQNLSSSCNPNLTITLLITDYNRLKWLKRQAFYKKLIWYHFRGLFAYGPIKFKHLTIQLFSGPITYINLRAIKLVKLDKLTGALLKSIQPVIDRWLFVKAMLRDNIALWSSNNEIHWCAVMNSGGVTDVI